MLFEVTGPTTLGGTDNSLTATQRRWRRNGEPLALHADALDGATLAPNSQYMPAVVLTAAPRTSLRTLTVTYTTTESLTGTAELAYNATYRRAC